MSRLVKGMLLFALAFVLGACSGGGETESETSESIVATEYGPLMTHYMEEMDLDYYYMKYQTETEGFGEEAGLSEITYAVDGDKLAVETFSEVVVSKMIINDDTMYIIDDEEQLVYFMDISDVEGSGVSAEGPMDLTAFDYVDAGTENGLEYEVYQYLDFTYTYYFDGSELVRVVNEFPDVRTVMDLVETSEPPEDAFDLPAEYELVPFDDMFEE